MKALKHALVDLGMRPFVPPVLKYIQQHCATIFMLHRFQDEERGIHGFRGDDLRTALAYLRRRGYELLSLEDVFRRLAGDGPPPKGAVAFTIDDGYIDQATIAAPIFAEFDCPVTTFVTTGFLDRTLWMWWDQIEFVFESTRQQAIRVELAGEPVQYAWTTEAELLHAQLDFTERCKLIPQEAKATAIADLAGIAGVEIPATPPPRSEPMSWDQLRSCERGGMSFGPHTVTHPVLSRTSADQAAHELAASLARLRQEARYAVPIFCYPNGGWDDFGQREIDLLRQLGIVGAVVGVPGYASAHTCASSAEGPFKVRRFALPSALPRVVQYVSGVEHLKRLARGIS